jgi:hypothetical protein
MLYSQLVARLEVLAVTRVDEDDDFATILPAAIEAGELRCLRDCDFPSARVIKRVTLTTGAASLAPPADMVVPRSLSVFTSVGGSTRQEVQRRDASYLREYAPDTSTRGVPLYFATTEAGIMMLAPAPSAAYELELEYTYRPAGLSSDNPSTWLSERYPDMLVFACMVFLSGYQRNFGAQTDDPQMPGSWGRLYSEAVAVARNESATGKGWGAFDHTPAPPPSGLAPTG